MGRADTMIPLSVSGFGVFIPNNTKYHYGAFVVIRGGTEAAEFLYNCL